MTPRHWLIKFAAFRTSWPEIVARGTFTPRGIRSPEARKHLSAMRLGDPVLFYRSQQDQGIVGLLEIIREAYSEPTIPDPQWLTCDFQPLRTLGVPVSLSLLRNTDSLRNPAPGACLPTGDLSASGASDSGKPSPRFR